VSLVQEKFKSTPSGCNFDHTQYHSKAAITMASQFDTQQPTVAHVDWRRRYRGGESTRNASESWRSQTSRGPLIELERNHICDSRVLRELPPSLPGCCKLFSMPDLYTSLGVSPRKKRRASPGADEATVLTPKRIRTRCVLMCFTSRGVNLG